MQTKPTPSLILFFTTVAFIAAMVVYFNAGNGGHALAFSQDGIQNVGRTFAPLVAIAAFIERAVEIAIATSRGPGSLECKRRLDAAEDPDAKLAARRELEDYRLHTQRYCFAIALGLSLFASMVGVRAAAPLLEKQVEPTRYFNMFDVLITSLLLAGGSDGVHQIVSTITTMLDTSKTQNQKKAQGD